MKTIFFVGLFLSLAVITLCDGSASMTDEEYQKEQRELQTLLNWAIEQTATKALPSSPGMDKLEIKRKAEALKSLDKKWLDAVWRSDADHMKALLSVILSDNSTVEDRGDALDRLEEFVEDLNNAIDLHSINGLVPVLHILSDNSSDPYMILSKAAHVVATAAQNNYKVQEQVVENGGLDVLLHQWDKHSGNQSEAASFLLAVSAVVRSFPPGRRLFIESDGLQRLERSIINGTDSRLLKRSLVLLCSILMDEPAALGSLLQNGAVRLRGLTSALFRHLFNAESDQDLQEKIKALMQAVSTADGQAAVLLKEFAHNSGHPDLIFESHRSDRFSPGSNVHSTTEQGSEQPSEPLLLGI